MRDFLRVGLLLPVVCIAACTCAPGQIPTTMSSSSSGDHGPCGEDCTAITTPQCTVAVCNTGQVVGPLNTCVVVPSPTGTLCDDGKFCTLGDACDNGVCVGGAPNTCGLTTNPCVAVICYEGTKSCDTTPVGDGTPCTPADLCHVNGVCKVGACVGDPKDCTFSPLNECNTATCDPATGKCVGQADPTKDNTPCVLTGDLCRVNRTCLAGLCGGGTAKDCSELTVGCLVGVCDSSTGACGPQDAPAGTVCTEGIAECHVGACDGRGVCDPSQAPDGSSCNDHDACTSADTCLGGLCSGGAVASCTLYFQEGFEVCPHGWTLGGDWQCGTPATTSPVTPHTGHGVLATQLSGLYHVNQSFSTTVADSPPIDLTHATTPELSFWRWDHTEGSTFDGWNLKISTDGGQTFTEVTTVTPAYDLSILGQPAWGGDHSAEGWQNYLADLTGYIGKSVILRFAFRSDAATVFTGVYIDDLVVAEPLEIPLYVSTPSLPDVYAGQAYSVQLGKTGGTSNAVWSIDTGGTNDAWLSIDPKTGLLSGTPTSANVGLVTLTVRVQEPSLPSNFAETTYSFHVRHALYYTSFEGACPAGWTLTGDWQCGVPTTVGPPVAFVGQQCLATQIGGNYHDNDTYAGNTATSPPIDLTGIPNGTLTFRMWVDTEGATYDGFNLQVSTDGGQTYSLLSTIVPPYSLMVGGQPAWGGHESALDWQLVKASLAPYAGKTITLRFAFQSDSSGNYPGVYIDDILVN